MKTLLFTGLTISGIILATNSITNAKQSNPPCHLYDKAIVPTKLPKPPKHPCKIWAEHHPKLAAKVKEGQACYKEIHNIFQ